MIQRTDRATNQSLASLMVTLILASAPLGLCADDSASVADPQALDTERLPLVLLLGDSIRSNYQAAVIAELKDTATVWTPQENGRHSEYTLQQLENWIAGRKPAVVHFNVGLHDMFLNKETGKPRHDLATYSSNLRQIIEKIQALTDAKIIFALTTPVNEMRQRESAGYGRIVRRSADIDRYNRAAVSVATEAGAAVNDVYGLSERIGADDILSESDGIHLSDFGRVVIGRQVAHAIDSALTDGGPKPLEHGFKSIFNGRNLEEWDHKPGAWQVHDGAIWCTGQSKDKNWLFWRGGQPSDFVLRMEFRWDKGNSGVQVRSDDQGDWMAFGYQVEVAAQSKMGLWHHSLLPKDHPKKTERHLMATAGQASVLATDGSKTVVQNDASETIQSHFQEHAWNAMEIIASGPTLTQKINGVVFATLTDHDKEMSRSNGFIALQDHGKGCKVAFRNIRLKTTTPKN